MSPQGDKIRRPSRKPESLATLTPEQQREVAAERGRGGVRTSFNAERTDASLSFLRAGTIRFQKIPMLKRKPNPTRQEFERLSPEAQDFYKSLCREWRLRDAAGQAIALTAAQALARLREAQEILRRDGLTITDRFGQVKMHPIVDAEQKARSGLLLALKSLELDLESLEVE